MAFQAAVTSGTMARGRKLVPPAERKLGSHPSFACQSPFERLTPPKRRNGFRDTSSVHCFRSCRSIHSRRTLRYSLSTDANGQHLTPTPGSPYVRNVTCKPDQGEDGSARRQESFRRRARSLRWQTSRPGNPCRMRRQSGYSRPFSMIHLRPSF